MAPVAEGVLGPAALGAALAPSVPAPLAPGAVVVPPLVAVPLGLGAFALLLCQLPADRGARTARLGDFDISGMVLLALSVAAYALGFTRQHDGFGVGNLAFLGLAAGGMVFFLRMQKRTASPLLRMELLEADALRSGLAMSLLVAAVMMSTLVVGPFYLAQTLAVPPGKMGLALSVGPLMAALVAGLAGRLVDRNAPDDGFWADRSRSRLPRTGAAAAMLRHGRLLDPGRRHDSRLLAVSDGQQHGRDAQCRV